MRPVCSLFVVVCLCALGAPAAAKWKSKGQITLEGRLFRDDGDPATVDQGLGMLGRVEVSHRHKPFREKMRVYGRLDSRDSNRTIFIAEELWAEVKLGALRLRVGADILNWTATEAFHPADIVNARNLDSDSESYEKVGEPMVRMSYDVGSGSISAFFFPYYTRTIFPAQSSRLSFIPPGIDVGPFIRMNANGKLTEDNFGPQGALRITQSFRGVDIAIHAVHHMDRLQPEQVVDPVTMLPRPLFRKVTQIGGTYQHVLGPVIAKVEAGYRIFARPRNGETPFGQVQDRDHLQVAAGLEYGFLVDSSAELTLLAEGQSIFLVDDDVRRQLGVFQRDVLVGLRLALNDISSTELRISSIVDIEDPDQVLLNASYSQRVGNSWGVSAAVRMVFGPENSSLNQGFSIPPQSDHVRLFVTRYF